MRGIARRQTLAHLVRLVRQEPAYLARQVPFVAARALQKRLAPYTDGRSRALKFAWIMLTYRCNLRCEMCSLWGEEGIWKPYDDAKLGEQMSASELCGFLDQIAPYRPMVLLTGGEPMLYSDWHRVAAHAKASGLRTAMSTNGTALAAQAEAVFQTIDALEISLDGVAHVHDQVRGKAGSFEKTCAGMAAVGGLKAKHKSAKPHLKVAFTLNNVNFRQLVPFARFLSQLPFPIDQLVVRHLEFTTREIVEAQLQVLREEFGRDRTVFAGYVYPPTEALKQEVLAGIEELMHMHTPNIRSIVFEPPLTREEAARFYSDPHFIPPRFQKCFSPWLGVSLLPSGDLWVCPDVTVGNIRKRSFEALWNGEEARAFRRRLQQKGLLPACRACASLYVY